MQQGAVIRLEGVTKTYQAGAPPALADLSLDVAAGEVAAVMGPSGSGKSTLLNLIAGLDRPTAGTITVAGAVALNTATVHAMAGTARTGIPASFTQAFPPARLALLSLAAVAIAGAGALLPASRAARARTAVALHAE